MLKKGDQCRSIAEPNYDKLIDTVANKKVKKLQDFSLCQSAEQECPSDINYVSNRVRRNHRKPNNNRYFGQGRSYHGKPQHQQCSGGNSNLRCRCCQSTEHLVMPGNCTLRFYQVCGNKGHDAWDPSCPKYQ